MAQQSVFAQKKPFSEAEKAMAASENAPIIYDSLRRVFKNRWTIGVTYGQRFIGNADQAAIPDTITFADFTKRRSSYGIEGSYFVSKNVQLFLSLNILVLPTERNINSLSFGNNGLQVDGSGNGGAMITAGIGSRYLFLEGSLWRPYVGLQLGNIRAVAKGGSISTSNNQNLQISELTRSYGYGNLMVGVIHRLTPGSLLDFNIGYLKANRESNIGGIVSPTGITASLSLHVVINARKD